MDDDGGSNADSPVEAAIELSPCWASVAPSGSGSACVVASLANLL